MTKIERLTRKLNTQLKPLNLKVRNIEAAKGYWRTSPHADVYRWEGVISQINGPWFAMVGSYDTVTECLKQGDLSFSEDWFECHAPS